MDQNDKIMTTLLGLHHKKLKHSEGCSQRPNRRGRGAGGRDRLFQREISADLPGKERQGKTEKNIRKINKMVREPNVSPHKQIIKDDDVKECISTE